jgi:hypothetical protein
MTFKEQLAKLIDLKSIITIAIVFTLVWLTMSAMTIDPFFSTIAGMVLGFYFGKAQTPAANTTTTTETTSTEVK